MPENIRVRVTPEEYDLIKAFAEKDRRNLSQFVKVAALEKCEAMQIRQAAASMQPMIDAMQREVQQPSPADTQQITIGAIMELMSDPDKAKAVAALAEIKDGSDAT